MLKSLGVRHIYLFSTPLSCTRYRQACLTEAGICTGSRLATLFGPDGIGLGKASAHILTPQTFPSHPFLFLLQIASKLGPYCIQAGIGASCQAANISIPILGRHESQRPRQEAKPGISGLRNSNDFVALCRIWVLYPSQSVGWRPFLDCCPSSPT